MVRKATLSTAGAYVEARQEFDANGTLRGVVTSWPSSGRLNETERARLDSDAATARELGAPFYVVYSYATPIAWGIGHSDLYKVTQRFSVTTSKHWGRFGVVAK
jgi:hypothetical protein